MMSRSLRESSLQVYETHWARFVAFCRSKRWHVFRVRSHHFSTYMMHLFRDGLLPTMIISHRTSVASVLHHWVYDPAADPHIKLLIRAFRLEHPVQRRIMPKWDLHLVLSSLLKPPFASECDIQGEFSDDVIPLKWRTMKTVSLLVLASARWCSLYICMHWVSRPAGVCSREEPPSDNLWWFSFAGTWFPCEESTTVTGSGMDNHTGDSPSQPVRSGEDAVSCQTAETLHTGLGKNLGGPSTDVCSLESQHQRYHEKSHQPMDCGDCQGSLHAS